MTDDDVRQYLSPAQLARVEALKASRNVQYRSEGFAKGAGPGDPIDLVAVARFIIDGNDPWQTVTTERDDVV